MSERLFGKNAGQGEADDVFSRIKTRGNGHVNGRTVALILGQAEEQRTKTVQY